MIFKGKTVKGDWVCGDLRIKITDYIPEYYVAGRRISSDTLSRNTGMVDSENNLIFEYDIIKCEGCEVTANLLAVVEDGNPKYTSVDGENFSKEWVLFAKKTIVGNLLDR